MASGQDRGWQCPNCTLHNSNEFDCCVVCFTCRSDRPTSSSSTHNEPCGPVKFTKEDLSLRSLMKRRAVYWQCPTCREKLESSIVRCTFCGFVRTNSYADESEGHGIGSRLKNWLSKVGLEVIDTSAVWRCDVCSVENQGEDMFCCACGSDRRAQGRPRQEYTKHTRAHERRVPERPPHPDFSKSTFTTSHDQHQQKLATEIPLSPKFSRETQDGLDVWTCSECTYENPLAYSHCTICNASKDLSEATLAAIDLSCNAASTSEYIQPSLPQDSSVTRDPIQRQHSLTVQEIRRLDEDKALSVWMTIVEEYKRSGGSFIDPDFPHSGKSLFLFPDCPQDWPVHGWLRPTMIKDILSLFPREQWTVYRNPSPSDIAQGQLGNCWFLSALAVIAEIPDLLQQIIVTKQFCPQGVYQLRLCKDGLWKVITVDDWFPCHYDKQLVFSKAKRKQLWVPLIEKGLAKIYGCYEALERGMIVEGLSLLTGCPCVRLTWKVIEPYLEDYLDMEEEKDDIELIWGRLLSMKESHFPMAACCGRSNVKEEDYKTVGLETRHAYSLLDVQQVGSQRLVKLRNPWGKSSWQGWQWQQEHEREEEGVFWIGAPDFFKYFSSVDVCKYHPTWHSVRVQGSIPPYATSTSKVVSFQVTAVTEIEFILYKPTYRGLEEARWHQNEVSMLIMEIAPIDASSSSLSLPKSCVLTTNYRISHGCSSITCSALFAPGHYAVLPLGFSHWHAKEQASDLSYVLALFSAKGVVVDGHVTTQPGFMAESIFLLAHKLGTVVKKFDGLTVYQVDLKPACYMIIAENKDQDCHYTLIGNIQPQNMVSTRNAVLTSDTLPPMHRQVLHLLTPSYMSEQCSYSFSMEVEQSYTGEGSWRTHHDPPLDDTVAELHCPRFII